MDVFTCRYKQGYKIHLKNACLYVVKSPGPPHSFPVVPAYGPGGQVKGKLCGFVWGCCFPLKVSWPFLLAAQGTMWSRDATGFLATNFRARGTFS